MRSRSVRPAPFLPRDLTETFRFKMNAGRASNIRHACALDSIVAYNNGFRRFYHSRHPGCGVGQAATSNSIAEFSFRHSSLPRITVDWDTSQADDFRMRGASWTIERTTL